MIVLIAKKTISWIKLTTRKLYNTLYYNCSNKKEFIVIRSWLIQWGNTICPRNFGDDVNFFLISKLSGKRIITANNFFHKKTLPTIMCIGSIIEHNSSFVTVWGSGAMYGDVNKFKPNPLKVCAVRGPLTRNYLLSLGVKCPQVYGDPALLLPYVYKPIQITKKWKIGIIPHVLDLSNRIIQKFIEETSNTTKIQLNNYKKWTDVIDTICACDVILSSSLHGLIISDAYAIPNVWIKLSDKVEGNGFKFKDYFLSVQRNTVEPIVVKNLSDVYTAIDYSSQYSQIKFDPIPLLHSCPFNIQENIL